MNAGARLQSLAGPYGVVIDSNIAEMAVSNGNIVLRKGGHPSLEMEILDHGEAIIKKARDLKGLSDKDKLNFKYVIWPYMQNKLWLTNGKPSL